MDRQKICYAKKVLRTMHPLWNLEIEVCLPFLYPVVDPAKRCLIACGLMKPKEEDDEAREGLAGADALKSDGGAIQKSDLELAQDDGERGPDEPLFDFFLEEGEDAMTRLGYGIVSYFNVIYTFMVIFFMILLFNIPVMYNNSSWAAFAGERQLSWTAQYTVGNLGQAQARCLNVNMETETLSVSCPTGQISEISHFGVYAKGSEADQRSLCTSEGVSVSTGLDCSSVSKKDNSFYTDKLAPCVGQESCLIHSLHDDITIGSQSGDPGCNISDTDTLFVQYNCKVSDEELATKRAEALLASVVNIFSALTLLAVVRNR